MSDVRTESGAPTRAPADPPPSEPPPARGSARGDIARRFLTLREGSIIVVTVIAAIYFALQNDRFFTQANFENLLPYFAPFAILAVGEVLLMVGGRDRPVDRLGLPVRAVHVLRVQPGRGSGSSCA